MNEEKQITELAKIICNACEMGNGFDGECANGNDYKKRGISTETARKIYDVGYRRASEVAAEVIGEIEEGIKAAISALAFKNNPIHRQVKHETYSSLMRFVKSVEKKYTEEQSNG